VAVVDLVKFMAEDPEEELRVLEAGLVVLPAVEALEHNLAAEVKEVHMVDTVELRLTAQLYRVVTWQELTQA